MRASLLAALALVLVAGAAGCIGGDADVDPASTAEPAEAEDDPNPWQAGLADHYPTPDVAKERSADERRANLAEPGHPEFAAFDARMESWMAEHDVPAGQLAVMRNGELRYERGYGHVDRPETQPTNASTMFRIASVTKPMTAALVSMQVEQGLYNWTDPVFCLGEDPAPNCRLPIEPHPSNPVEDERLEDITVRHLVEHQGGWGEAGNWVQFGSGAIEVARELGVESPPRAWQTAQFLMGETLEHEPGGGDDPYCNVCYMLAGLVAEAATGAELEALYDAYLFRPLEVQGEIERGYALPEDRNPREPFYACEGEMPNVFRPNETVCAPDGGWSMEAELGNGGLVATASAVAAVYELHAHHGGTYEPAGTPYAWDWHGGGFPGTSTVAMTLAEGQDLAGKVQVVFLFNAGDLGEHCEDVPSLPFAGQPECERYHLIRSMSDLATTWGAGHEAVPAGGASP